MYEFGHVVSLGGTLGTVRYVSVIRDPFNNRLEFSYFSAPGPVDAVSQIRQILGGGQVREINFGYDATLKGLSSMTYGSRVWTYTQEAAGPSGFSRLARVQPPAGLATEYAYSASAPGHELSQIMMPSGGTVTYSYMDVIQNASSVTTRGRGVSTKTLAGYSATSGTWTYTYGPGANQDTTRVDCPCGTTTYRFNGIGTTGTFSGWLAGTVAEQTVEDQGVVLEREQFTWEPSEGISTDPTVGTGGIWTDPGVFKALLKVRSVTRGTQSWTTTLDYHSALGNFNDYGRPWRISEDGELHRVITRTFQYGFTPYLVDRLASEQVQQGAEIVASSWTYNLATGFLDSQTLTGFTTTFTPTTAGTGQMWKAKDGNNHETLFTYTWGRVAQVQTPHVTTTYTVNADGTIASATVGTLTTTYGYDAAFRPTIVQPPGTNAVTYRVRRPGSAMGARQSRNRIHAIQRRRLRARV